MTKTPRIPIPNSVKQYIYERDKHQCQSCGQTQAETKLNIDHIIPLVKGGSNDMSNLQTLCQTCNQKKKHDLDPRFNRHFE